MGRYHYNVSIHPWWAHLLTVGIDRVNEVFYFFHLSIYGEKDVEPFSFFLLFAMEKKKNLENTVFTSGHVVNAGYQQFQRKFVSPKRFTNTWL